MDANVDVVHIFFFTLIALAITGIVLAFATIVVILYNNHMEMKRMRDIKSDDAGEEKNKKN